MSVPSRIAHQKKVTLWQFDVCCASAMILHMWEAEKVRRIRCQGRSGGEADIARHETGTFKLYAELEAQGSFVNREILRLQLRETRS